MADLQAIERSTFMSQYDMLSLLPPDHQPALAPPAWVAEYSMLSTIPISKFLQNADSLDTRLVN